MVIIAPMGRLPMMQMDVKKSITGFTMIEIILVLVIVGILSVAVGTIVIRHERAYIEIAAQKVRADIEHARGFAMTKKGTTFGVSFDDANDRYTVYENGIATPVKDPQTKQDLIETFSRWKGVTITGGNYVVEFNSFGAPTTGGGGSVRITDGENTKTISVTAVTGKVGVQ